MGCPEVFGTGECDVMMGFGFLLKKMWVWVWGWVLVLFCFVLFLVGRGMCES